MAGGTDADKPHPSAQAFKPMPEATGPTNARKSSIRAAVEHAFAHQKARFGLFIRTIGLACAEAKLWPTPPTAWTVV